MKNKVLTLHLALFLLANKPLNVSSGQMGLEDFESYLSKGKIHSTTTRGSNGSINSRIFSGPKRDTVVLPLHDTIVLKDKQFGEKGFEKLKILHSDDRPPLWIENGDYNNRSIDDLYEDKLFAPPPQTEDERIPYAKFSGHTDNRVKQVPTVSPMPDSLPPQSALIEQAQTAIQEKAPALSNKSGEGLLDFVEKWRMAWSSKDIETYMDCYSRDFRSGSLGKKEWRQKKSSLNHRYEYIEISIDDIVVEHVPGEAKISFFQKYKSDKYTTSGRKTLELITEGHKWKIHKEY